MRRRVGESECQCNVEPQMNVIQLSAHSLFIPGMYLIYVYIYTEYICVCVFVTGKEPNYDFIPVRFCTVTFGRL